MSQMIVLPLAIMIALAGVPASAAEADNSSQPPQGGNAPAQSTTPVPPPPQRDCHSEEAVS